MIYAKLALISMAHSSVSDSRQMMAYPTNTNMKLYEVLYGKSAYQQALNLQFIVFINPVPGLIWKH